LKKDVLPFSPEVFIEYLANLDVGDRTGKTALHHAAYNGHVQMLSLLLLKGASVKTKDRTERTPLHYAAFHGLSLSLSLIPRHKLVEQIQHERCSCGGGGE
jgi:serine/threonine-protein phosphatase 6 regulatory ankyrin repeat subunit A